MFNKVNSKPMFENTQAGLYQIFQKLAAENGTLSKEDLANFKELGFSDMSFFQLLSQGFNNFDANKDGVISQEELNNSITQIGAQGLTYDQLISLSMQTGGMNIGANKELLETVLTHFSKIDKNRDGRINEAEISAYQIEKEIHEKEKEISEIKSSNYSIYYSDSSSSDSKSSSMLDYKYVDSKDS